MAFLRVKRVVFYFCLWCVLLRVFMSVNDTSDENGRLCPKNETSIREIFQHSPTAFVGCRMLVRLGCLWWVCYIFFQKLIFKKNSDKMYSENRKMKTALACAWKEARFWRFCKRLKYRRLRPVNRNEVVVCIKRAARLRQMTSSFASNDALVPIKRQRRKA